MKQTHAYILVLGAVVIAFGIGMVVSGGLTIGQLKDVAQKNSKPAFAAGSYEAFDYLSNTKSKTSSFCSLQPQTVGGFSDEDNIQGACCAAMDFHRYQEQVALLKKYKNISRIPEDPYNIPVSLAKDLFEYQKSITLTYDQQQVYDQATEISHEGGPCCCRCWRWTAFEGLAKYLITVRNFNSQEVADLWDLLDGCGGPGHAGEEGH